MAQLGAVALAVVVPDCGQWGIVCRNAAYDSGEAGEVAALAETKDTLVSINAKGGLWGAPLDPAVISEVFTKAVQKMNRHRPSRDSLTAPWQSGPPALLASVGGTPNPTVKYRTVRTSSWRGEANLQRCDAPSRSGPT